MLKIIYDLLDAEKSRLQKKIDELELAKEILKDLEEDNEIKDCLKHLG